jgi:hypothetical protein
MQQQQQQQQQQQGKDSRAAATRAITPSDQEEVQVVCSACTTGLHNCHNGVHGDNRMPCATAG